LLQDAPKSLKQQYCFAGWLSVIKHLLCVIP